MKALDTNKPHLIIMVGIPGSGKSFFAENFAETFKAPLISIDKLSNVVSKDTKSNLQNNQTNSAINYILGEVVKTCRTIIYEGETNLRSERTALMKYAKNAGYEPLFIWVQIDPVTAKKRIFKKYKENNTDIEEFDSNLKKFSTPHSTEKFIVISGKHTYASQLKIVLKHLIKASPINDNQSVRTQSKRNYLIR